MLALGLAAKGQEIILEGFVPQGISAAMISFEYKRIWKKLAPGRRLDTAPLTATYFTKRSMTSKISLPEWGGGGAVGRGHIAVALDAEPFLYADFARTTVHELVHIAISRICTTTTVPRWFHEGTAMALSGEVTFAEQVVLSRAILTTSLVPLADIDSVNGFGRFRAQLAYAQSHQAVLLLIDTYGIEVLQEILAGADKHGSFAAGLREALQLSEDEIQSMARAHLVREFRLAFFFADTYLMWLGILVLFVAGYVATVIRNRRRARAMAQEESLGSAADGGDTPAA
jgi:hypothetical protein